MCVSPSACRVCELSARCKPGARDPPHPSRLRYLSPVPCRPLRMRTLRTSPHLRVPLARSRPPAERRSVSNKALLSKLSSPRANFDGETKVRGVLLASIMSSIRKSTHRQGIDGQICAVYLRKWPCRIDAVYALEACLFHDHRPCASPPSTLSSRAAYVTV